MRKNGRKSQRNAEPMVFQANVALEKDDWLPKTLDILGLLICFAGIWASVRGNFAGRSLFVDEASVVYSIQTRSLWNMTSAPLPYHQTAPVLWLWLVKTVTLVFGSSEVVLRSLSVVSYTVALGLTGWAAKRFFEVRCPWLVSAFLANMRAFLCYSNVVKPYEFEAVCVLAVVIAYGFLREGKWTWWATGGVWLGAMLGGNPSVFFISACLLHEELAALRGKRWKTLLEAAIVGLVLGGVFTVYYAGWLRGVANSEFMQDWWRGNMLSAWPPTLENFARNWQVLFGRFFKPTFGERAYTVAWLSLGAATMAWTGPFRLRRILVTGLLLGLAASGLGLFPIDMRLWVFSFPCFAILLVGLLMDCQTGRATLPMAILALGFVFGQYGIPRYLDRDNVYWTGEELNPLLDYVQGHLQNDESVYVTDRAIPGTKYHFGYDFERFGNGERENVIWGSDTWERDSDVTVDAGRIEEAEKCWLVLIPVVRSKTDGLWYRLSKSGRITKVYEFKGTPLYYYERGVFAQEGCGS